MVRDRIKLFLTDFVQVGLSIINLLLLIAMIFDPNERDTFFWIYFGMRVTFIPITILFGDRGIWVFYFIYTNIKALDITFDNLTCVAIISLLFTILPKVDKKKAIVIAALYVTDIFIVASIHNKQPFYIYVHLLGCLGYCIAMWKLKSSISNNKRLKLLPDEIKILTYLSEGRLQKEILEFSENTVYRKLKEARIRNGIKDNEELLMIFMDNKDAY